MKYLDPSDRIQRINECLSFILEKLIDDPVEPGKSKAPVGPPAKYSMSEPYTDYHGVYHPSERVYADDIGPKDSVLHAFDPMNSQDPLGAFGVGLVGVGGKLLAKTAARTGTEAIEAGVKTAATKIAPEATETAARAAKLERLAKQKAQAATRSRELTPAIHDLERTTDNMRFSEIPVNDLDPLIRGREGTIINFKERQRNLNLLTDLLGDRMGKIRRGEMPP